MRTDVASNYRSVAVAAAALAVAGCAPDSVAFGYYGAPDAEVDSPGVAVEPPDAELPPTGADAAVEPVSDGGDAASAIPSTTLGCNLAGRWLVADREVATGIGAEEAAHEWFYFELGQTGAAVTVTKGLLCGENVVGISAVSANIDDHKVWPAMQIKAQETGRTATSAATSSGCSVSFAKYYEVLGATVAYYQDPSAPLPDASTEATASAPGWEDWDEDGHPGFTMNVTGLATGQIYLASRRWNAWSGSIDAGSNTFTLADNWSSEQDLLGYTGSSLLQETASGTKDNDATLHFVTFVRLGPTQATGDDTATCAAVRSLAPMVAPQATN